MKDWKIVKRNNFYLPKVDRWIMDTFGLDVSRAVVYQVILNKGYLCWTLDYFAMVLGYCKKTIQNILQKLCDMDIIIKHTVSTNIDSSTPRRRTIYVARYTTDGERPRDEIESLIEQGQERILSDYFDGKNYKIKKS